MAWKRGGLVGTCGRGWLAPNRREARANVPHTPTLPPTAALTLLLYVGSRAACTRWLHAYRRLNAAAARDLDSRTASTLHAVAVAAAAAVALPPLLSAAGDTPLTLRTSATAQAALAASAGYFAADSALVSSAWPALGGADMLAHHAAALASLTAALVTRQGHAPCLLLLACEATTPCVNARAWLDKALTAKASRAYAVNGLALLAAWGLVRVCGMGVFLVYLASPRGRADAAALSLVPRTLLLTVPPALYCLNLWWFARIARGAVKMLASRRVVVAPASVVTPPPQKPAPLTPAIKPVDLWRTPPPPMLRLSPPAAALATLSAACRLGAERAPAWARRTAAAAGF